MAAFAGVHGRALMYTESLAGQDRTFLQPSALLLHSAQIWIAGESIFCTDRCSSDTLGSTVGDEETE